MCIIFKAFQYVIVLLLRIIGFSSLRYAFSNLGWRGNLVIFRKVVYSVAGRISGVGFVAAVVILKAKLLVVYNLIIFQNC